MSIYFTSDWHWGHDNIIKLCGRPFLNTDEMNLTIINNINNCLSKNDVLYVIGDVAFKSRSDLDNLFSLIRKDITIHLIVGNHDTRKVYRYFRNVYFGYKDIKIKEQYITLCHFPMTSYKKSHFDAWHLYGHHHWNTNDQLKGKRMNVCVDIHNFKPVSFNQVSAFMKKRTCNWDYIHRPKRNIE